MKKINAVIAVFVIATMMFMGCAKDGATGPAGPAGANGNANVIGSSIVTVNGTDWVAVGAYFKASITDADITQAVVDNGAVFVYVQNGTTSWLALPYTFSIVARSFQFYVGGVDIFYENTDGSQTLNPATQIFRLVIIPSSSRMTNENINFKNYEEVKHAFNLKD